MPAALASASKLRPNLLSRELAQAQAKELALQEVAEEEQRLLAEAKAAGTSVSAFAKAKMHEAGVQLVAARMEDMDVTPQHQRFLREAAAENELETTARINKLAFYEQATSPHLPTSPHISLYLHVSPYIAHQQARLLRAGRLPTSPHISTHLPMPPYTSPYLPIYHA